MKRQGRSLAVDDARGYRPLQVPCDADWTLETERLELAPMVEGDSDALFALLKHPEIHIFTGDRPPASADGVRATIRRRESRRSPEGDELWLNWTLRLKADQSVAGYIQAGVKPGGADMAWIIGVAFQRQGLASEASQQVLDWLRDHLRVSEVSARINPDHTASQKVARNIGLRNSGTRTDVGEEVWRANLR